MKLTTALLQELLDYYAKCRGRKPLLHIDDEDSITWKFLAEETNSWNNKDESRDVGRAEIEDFLRQLVDCIRLIDNSDRIAIMKRIQTLGGYGYSSGGVSGRNDYSSDVSKADGSLIQRKR